MNIVMTIFLAMVMMMQWLRITVMFGPWQECFASTHDSGSQCKICNAGFVKTGCELHII